MKKAVNQSTLTSILNLGSILALVLAIVASIGVVVVNIKQSEAEVNRYDLVLNANRFMDASSYLTTQVRTYAVSSRIEHYENYMNEVNTLKNRDIGVENMKAIGLTEEELAKIEEMSGLSNQLVPLETAAMENVSKGDTEAAIEAVYGDSYEKTIIQIDSIKQEFSDMISDRAKVRVDSLTLQSTFLWIGVAIMLAIVVALQITSFIIIRKKIIKPIIAVKDEMLQIDKGNLSSHFSMTADSSEIGMLVGAIISTKDTLRSYIMDISEKLEAMAENDMSIKIDMEYIGDFVPIKTALGRITNSLNSTLSQINNAASQVSDGAELVSGGSQSLSQGTTEQASAVEQLSASITQISAQVKENASHSSEASSIANKTGNELSESNARLIELGKAISNINVKSTEISKIIKTIDDIAFQTNILALNAAVEAARAGVAGKGFAVVADEVRNLSGKSTQAAKNITVLIEDSMMAVKVGTTLAESTIKAMAETVTMAQEVVSSIEQISEASSQQASSISQVQVGLDQISNVVQSNAETSQESAAASEELSSQAQMLKELVGKFTLHDE